MVVPDKADGAALFWKSGGLPISYECKKEKMNWNAFSLFLPGKKNHTGPHCWSGNRNKDLFASQMPLLCNAISICLNTSLIPQKKENISGFTAMRVFLLQLLGRLCFLPHCFVSMVTFWVALPQVKIHNFGSPIHGVVTEKRNTTPRNF